MKAEALDARSDLYSVGVTLYEMVTGETPVQGSSYYAILKAHLEGKPRPPVELVPGLAPELSRVIEKSLEKAPAARFQTGGGVSRRIEWARPGPCVRGRSDRDAERAGDLRRSDPAKRAAVL